MEIIAQENELDEVIKILINKLQKNRILHLWETLVPGKQRLSRSSAAN